jgi:hypothetical protein
MEHDLFGKPVFAFPDRARKPRMPSRLIDCKLVNELQICPRARMAARVAGDLLTLP